MKLYFQNSKGIKKYIAEVANEDDVSKNIHKFLDEHNYKSHYTRTWMRNNNEKVYDVGSWTEFFVVYLDG